MGMVVRTNTMAMNANRQLSVNNNQVGKSLEKLSSGFRINRAADDASGLAISEKMKAQNQRIRAGVGKLAGRHIPDPDGRGSDTGNPQYAKPYGRAGNKIRERDDTGRGRQGSDPEGDRRFKL